MLASCFQITNNCPEDIKIFYHLNRPKKKGGKKKNYLLLKVGESTHQILQSYLIGSFNWDDLQSRKCVSIISSLSDWRYISIQNNSKKMIGFTMGLPKKKRKGMLYKPLTINPGRKSKVVDIKVIKQTNLLIRMIKDKNISIIPKLPIGPPRKTSHGYGWYDGEDVYTCYKCGRPIVFRGYPPTPIHI